MEEWGRMKYAWLEYEFHCRSLNDSIWKCPWNLDSWTVRKYNFHLRWIIRVLNYWPEIRLPPMSEIQWKSAWLLGIRNVILKKEPSTNCTCWWTMYAYWIEIEWISMAFAYSLAHTHTPGAYIKHHCKSDMGMQYCSVWNGRVLNKVLQYQ